LSATPLIREDGKDISTVALLGPVRYSIDVKTLAANKYLVLPKIKWIDCKLERYKGINDYGYIYNECIAKNADRNMAVCRAIENAMKPVITFVTKHEHQKFLYHLSKYRSPSVLVNEHTSIEERNKIVEQLKCREIQHVISTQVFSEGMDVP
jgi:superfamily II DNA or RNA helicase